MAVSKPGGGFAGSLTGQHLDLGLVASRIMEKEISLFKPHSLCVSHTTNSLEKTLMLVKIEGRKKRE